MKTVLRLALPPLRELHGEHPVAFVLLGRDRRLLRSGELPLDGLAQAAPGARIEAVLHPADTVVTELIVPPLARRHQGAAIAALIEPLTLSAVEQLAIGQGPRQADGRTRVAWIDRRLLARGWQQLSEAGVQLADIVPSAAVLPDGDPTPELPLTLPAGERWRAPAQRWSMALPELRPANAPLSRWRRPLHWAVAATAVWLLGLNLYADQLDGEAQALRQAMQTQVRGAFPDIPVVMDPLKQATQRRDSLRAAQGETSDGDFMPLALSTARLLPAGSVRVQALRYDAGVLHLDLEDDDDTPAAPDAGPIQQAAAQGLALRRNETGWQVSRAASGTAAGSDASAGAPTSRVRLQGGFQ